MKNSLFFLTFCLFISCHTKRYDMHARVNITKIVDSLPCETQITYQRQTETIQGELWQHNEYLYFETTVIIKATGISNVAKINVDIASSGSSSKDSCKTANCTVEVRRDLGMIE